MTKVDWQKIEADFRLWAFFHYFNRVYENVHDNTVRFGLAIIASTQPIRDRKAVLEWKRHNKRNMKYRQKEFTRITGESIRRQNPHLQNGKEST